MQKKVEEYINDNNMLKKCPKVVLGLSGGADSVCLLIILSELCQRSGIDLTAVHINHQIRGNEADNDEEYCLRLCESMNVRFVAKHYDVPSYAANEHLSLEEAGRMLRYQAFMEEAGENGVIAVAHHKNDQTETVLFNIVRGSRLKGVAGIKPVRDRIIRPLLCVTRDEIECFLQEKNIGYCTDSTNLSDAYARNLMRNQIVPRLCQINERAVEHIAEFSKGANEAEEFLSELTNEKFDKCAVVEDGRVLLNIDDEHPYMAKRLAVTAFWYMNKGMKDITEKHIDEIIKLNEAQAGAYKHIKHGVVVERTRNGLLFYNEELINKIDIMEVVPPARIELDNGRKVIEFSVEPWDGNKKITNLYYTKVLDYDKIKFGLQLRNWQQGDVISIDDMGHHKKLKQYFIDNHMSRVDKEEAILIADGNDIVWVIGGRIGADYKITDNTQNVLRICITGEKYGES